MNLFQHGSEEEIQDLSIQQQKKYSEMKKAKYQIAKMLLKEDEEIRADIKKSV